MKNFFYNKNKKITTPRIIIFLFLLLFVFIPYLIVFLLVGEINLLKLNWFKIASENSSYIFNINILYIFIGIIALSCLCFCVFKFWLKIIDLDIIPFLLMTHAICLVTITSGLIPYTKSNLVYIIIARFFIVIISSLLVFVVSSWLINSIILNGINSYDYYVKFKNDENEQKKLSDDINKYKNHEEKDYIEIEKD